MSTEITYWGASCFELVTGDQRILIDPYLTGNPKSVVSPDDLETPNLILITHNTRGGNDHYGDAEQIARRTGAPVIADRASIALLRERGIPVKQTAEAFWGIQMKVGPILVRPVRADHIAFSTLADGREATGCPLSLIVEPEPGVRVYHYGDTAIYDMRLIGEMYSPTVALLGCTQMRELLTPEVWPQTWVQMVSGELGPHEAARVAEMLGVRLAVACHYLEPDDAAAQFVKLVPEYDSSKRRKALAPRAGDTFTVDENGLVEGSYHSRAPVSA
jgi:L-ascorbate metabolism protein UlaG (beta-lactamase superfamily)